MSLAPDTLPRLAPHVRLRFDETRQAWVMLAPERVLLPDEVAVEVLRRCTGRTPLSAIVDELAASFDADRAEIERDVIELLHDLAAKGMVRT